MYLAQRGHKPLRTEKPRQGCAMRIAFTTALPLLIAAICSRSGRCGCRKNSCSLEFDCEKLRALARSITESAALVTSLPHFCCRKLLTCIMASLLTREVSGCGGIQVHLAEVVVATGVIETTTGPMNSPSAPKAFTPPERKKHKSRIVLRSLTDDPGPKQIVNLQRLPALQNNKIEPFAGVRKWKRNIVVGPHTTNEPTIGSKEQRAVTSPQRIREADQAPQNPKLIRIPCAAPTATPTSSLAIIELLMPVNSRH